MLGPQYWSGLGGQLSIARLFRPNYTNTFRPSVLASRKSCDLGTLGLRRDAIVYEKGKQMSCNMNIVEQASPIAPNRMVIDSG